MIVLGISAYFFFEYSSEQRRIASENSTALFEQFLDAEDEARSEVFQEIEKTFPKSSSHILALMTEVGSLFEAGQNDEARKLLEKALSLSPNVLLADLIRIRLARAFRDINDGQAAYYLEICKGCRLQIWRWNYRRYLFFGKRFLKLSKLTTEFRISSRGRAQATARIKEKQLVASRW